VQGRLKGKLNGKLQQKEKTMNDLTQKKSGGPSVLTISPLPPHCTERMLSDNLLSYIGLDIDESWISVDGGVGTVIITRDVAAKFVHMCLKSVGCSCNVSPAKPRVGKNRAALARGR
jgi:hypothetical protein